MRLQLGGDELLFLDESGATFVEDMPHGGSPLARWRWLLAVICVLALAAVLWLWATR
jgi:hypothetical protein